MNISVNGLISVDLKNLLNKFENIFVVVSIFLYSADVIPLILSGGASEGDGFDYASANLSLNRNLFLLNYLIAFALLALRWKKSLAFLQGNYLFFALTALLPVSYLWSAMPDETLTGSIGMIGTTLFGIYIASRFTLKEQLRLLCVVYIFLIALSLLFTVLLPQYGIMGAVHAGAVRGIYTHKNLLGKSMVFGVAIFLIYAKSMRSSNWLPWLGMGGAFALILLSSSSSSLLNATILIAVVLSAQMIQLRGKNLFLSLILLAALLFALSQWFLPIVEAIVTSLGKDMTLTGRTDIWPYSISKIQERPWLGYGFNGFWHGTRGESLDMVLALRWAVPNSHNGFIDLWLELGFVGFSLFLLLIWSLILKIFFILRHKFDWTYVWPLALIIYIVIINFVETSLIGQNSFGWLLFIVVALSINRDFARLTRNGDLS